jgi:hypothetical protein
MRKTDFAAAAVPVMPEPRLAVIADGRSGSPDTADNEGELEPTRSDRIDRSPKKPGAAFAEAQQQINASLRRCRPRMPVVSACERRKNGAPRLKVSGPAGAGAQSVLIESEPGV